jgi:hypothetical protein
MTIVNLLRQAQVKLIRLIMYATILFSSKNLIVFATLTYNVITLTKNEYLSLLLNTKLFKITPNNICYCFSFVKDLFVPRILSVAADAYWQAERKGSSFFYSAIRDMIFSIHLATMSLNNAFRDKQT